MERIVELNEKIDIIKNTIDGLEKLKNEFITEKDIIYRQKFDLNNDPIYNLNYYKIVLRLNNLYDNIHEITHMINSEKENLNMQYEYLNREQALFNNTNIEDDILIGTSSDNAIF